MVVLSGGVHYGFVARADYRPGYRAEKPYGVAGGPTKADSRQTAKRGLVGGRVGSSVNPKDDTVHITRRRRPAADTLADAVMTRLSGTVDNSW